MTRTMANYDQNWIMEKLLFVVVCCALVNVNAGGNNEPLTACQHLQQAESRRAKSLHDYGSEIKVTVPKCSPDGEFEQIQCSNEINGTECWCVDNYGAEIAATRKNNRSDVICDVETSCPAHSCRMYCPGGFARSPRSGCQICQCRDPCDGVICPGGLSCQPQEVNCKTDPCFPVPTCKKGRSLSDLCPAEQPLTITDTTRPFLCGNDAGKPTCPPLYKCLVQSNNDYGVCCPTAIGFKRPGECPQPDDVQSSPSTGRLCGMPCSHDLECPQMEKCCQSNGCGTNCRQPFNVTTCHQARMLTEILSVNEREGRGYIPECEGPSGTFSEKQCSRNGLVCWCVDPPTGNKIKGSMGAAAMVNCEGLSNMIVRSQGRSADMTTNCDQNICASVCEYGFKPDHNGCPSCECSEPCENFICPLGTHCEVAKDPECRSGSALCASLPVCKPNFAYTNPCEIGVPLTDNHTGEVMYCRLDPDDSEGRLYQSRSFFDDVSGRFITNLITCPNDFDCIKLHKETDSVCCPHIPESLEQTSDYRDVDRPQSMCEYLRDFSDRMEGTEAGMTLALPSPQCKADGGYEPMMCRKKTIKVTSLDRRRILEEKNVRQMRMLLNSSRQKRSTIFECPLYKCVPCEHGYLTDENGCQTCDCMSPTQHQCPVYRCQGCEFGYKYDEMGCMTCKCLEYPQRTVRGANPENLRLVKVDESSDENRGMDLKSLIKYLRQNLLARSNNGEANYISEILRRKLLHQVVQERNAKVIDVSSGSSANLEKGGIKSDLKDKKIFSNQELVEVEIDECWCVDGFGTEIPSSRGTNVTMKSCQELRDSLECLDLTCRMGCEYGFILDSETKCPSCECRDPCDSVTCADGEECRSVEVTCIGEYCPPVPACLPRKNGQCPFLVPPGTEGSTTDSCEYDCRSDSHCEGTKRCCSNGCGTQCVEPELKTACQHLKTIQLHQASELGVPPRQKYIVQCDEKDGSWKPVQCGPDDTCWCVDQSGNELSGTRTLSQNGQLPNCNIAPKTQCPMLQCSPCEYGYVVDKSGCSTCECRMPCKNISCPGDEECKMMKIECIDEPCPLLPICVPHRESVCSDGFPYTLNDRYVSCGPQNDAEICPSTHTCQLDIESRKGVCCSKSRDVCFEAVDSNCSAENVTDVYSRWRFSPKSNNCVPVTVQKSCQSKNLFHNEQACLSVCPVLSQCERLRLRNSLAAKRSGQQLAFQPRCDPDTGSWSPVQCLGKSSKLSENKNRLNRAFSIESPEDPTNTIGVCWCADKKGAPVKGTLTRGTEPMCNHRQARRRTLEADNIQDPVIEELIRQMTRLADEDNFIETDNYVQSSVKVEEISTTTERILEIANSIYETSEESTHALIHTKTRCNALKATASFNVACDTNGSFEPTQCNDESICWCVDAAGNQISETSTFRKGTNKCVFTQIDIVSIELYLSNHKKKIFRNIYDTLKEELQQLLGDVPDNLRVHENSDGNIHIKFDLTDDNKIDTAFALEEMVKKNNLILVNGELRPDITMSRFVHRSSNLPVPQNTALIPENTFQTIVFILATTSAFLVSIFVVFIMLKRGKNKMKSYNTNKSIGMGDKLDYSSPIFVLSANDDK